MPTSPHAPERATDVTITDSRGLFLLQPESKAARAWLEANCAAESYQWINGGLVVDGREYAEPIMAALVEAGFVVR